MKKIFVLLVFLMAFLFLFPKSPKAASPNPVSWQTENAKFVAYEDFYIRIKDRYFYGQEPFQVSSDPGTEYTTLEVIWQEDGVPMRFFAYFRKKNANEWELYDLRTYDGSKDGEWIFYDPIPELGNPVSSLVGQRSYEAEKRFKAKDGVDAEIYCKGCEFNAFLPPTAPLTKSEYVLKFATGLQAGEPITLAADSNQGYVVDVVLYDRDGRIVTDQADFQYQVSSSPEGVVSVSSSRLPLTNSGKCLYEVQTPCPYARLGLAGLKPGLAQVKVELVKDNQMVASDSLLVKVIGATSSQSKASTPTPTPTLVVEQVPGSDQDNFSAPNFILGEGLDEDETRVVELEEKVKQLESDVAKQQVELSWLQRLVESILNFFHLKGVIGGN